MRRSKCEIFRVAKGRKKTRSADKIMFGRRFFHLFLCPAGHHKLLASRRKSFRFMKIHCNMNERGSDFSHNAQLRARAVYISYTFDKKNESWNGIKLTEL